MKIVHQGQDKEVTTQPEPQFWLPAPMLHGERLMDSASLRDFKGGESAYVANVLERSLLLLIDMAELGGLRRQEVFLNIKRYLGMVRLPTLVVPMILVPWFFTHHVLVSIGRLSRLPIGWRRQPTTKAQPWRKSVTSAWMPLRPSRTSRPTS